MTDTIKSTDLVAVRGEARSWFEASWSTDLTLREWWSRLGSSGFGFPTWPAHAYGRGLDAEGGRVIAEERARVGAYGAPSGIGPMMAGPTIATHGTPDQIERFLPNLVGGVEIWCQLFSEPGAGSDLAGITTRAERDGDEWIVNGQKVWTSGAQHSRWGILIARTNPEAVKHEGITYFVIDLHQPGVEVRPLREMTGGATFNEVFLTDARVPHANLLGDVDRGWAVALTTLSHERANLGAGAMGGMAGGAMLGIEIGGSGGGRGGPDLDARVGDLTGAAVAGGLDMTSGMAMLRMLPAMFGRQSDAVVRQEFARVHTLVEIARYTGLRAKAAAERGHRSGPEASTGKLAASHLMRTIRDAMLRLEGPAGTLVGDDAPLNGMAQWMALFSPAISIAGGTDEVQRNIIGERVLGLPPEPRPDKDVPFRMLPSNR